MTKEKDLKKENELLQNELDIFMSINARINMDMNIDDILDELIDTIIKKIDFDLCSIALIDENDFIKLHKIIYSKIKHTISFNEEMWNLLVEKKFDYKKDKALFCKAARENNEIYLPEIDNKTLSGNEIEYIKEYGITGCYILPIKLEGRIFGSIQFMNTNNTMQLTDYEKDLIRRRVFMVARILDNVKIYNEIKEKNQQLQNRGRIISEDLCLASKIQQNLLPKHLPIIPEIQIATRYMPMIEIGGDYYDFLVPREYKKNFGVIITDASGHGVSAAFITTMLKMSFQSGKVRSKSASPAAVLTEINDMIIDNTAGNFVTAIYCFFDIENKKVRLSSAGHPPVFIINKNSNELKTIQPNSQGKGGPLGLLDDLDYAEIEITINPGDRFFFYTDGLLEAFDQHFIQFKNKLLELLVKNRDLDLESYCDLIIENLVEHATYEGKKSLDDDVAIVAIDFLE